ncbi:unnamed protein product, partial [Coregonus sp. 'balchen']
MEKTPVSGLHLQTKGNHGIRDREGEASSHVYGTISQRKTHPSSIPRKLEEDPWDQDGRHKELHNSNCPYMTAYKLVTVHFRWWGLQGRVENFIHKQEKRLFTNFHRQLFCWLDRWVNLTMDDIRRMEEET